MKTLKAWEKSNYRLDAYLGKIPCQIDEALALYIGECVAPQYCSPDFTQTGEPDYEKYGVECYITTSSVDGKYYFLGILPEFKQ